MERLDAAHFFDKQIKTRWTEWAETETERSDWIRRLLPLTFNEARKVVEQLSDKSWGKKPSARDFLELSNKINSVRPKKNTYYEIPVFFIYLGDAPGNSTAGRWSKGHKEMIIVCLKGNNDLGLNEDQLNQQILEHARWYIRQWFRGIDPSLFEIYLNEQQAWKRKWELFDSFNPEGKTREKEILYNENYMTKIEKA